MQVIQDRILYVEDALEDAEQNPPQWIINRVKDLETQISQLEEEIGQQKQNLKEDDKEYAALWKKNVKLAAEVKRLQKLVATLTEQKTTYRAQTSLLEINLRRSIYIAPLPKNFSRLNQKQQRRLLQQLREQNRLQQNEITRLLAERDVEFSKLTAQAEKTGKEYSQARNEQSTVISQLWVIIERRIPTQEAIDKLQREITQLKRDIKDVQEEPLRAYRQELDELELIETILEETINRKVVSKLQRIQVNLYVIIRERDEDVTTIVDGQLRRRRKKYPKGKFQVLMNLDSFIEPDTDTVLVNVDPTLTLIPLLQEAAASVVADRLHVNFFPGEFTFGVTNAYLGTDDLGTPPEVVQVARSTNDYAGAGSIRDGRFSNLNATKTDWSRDLGLPIMTQQEYNELIEPMQDYTAELKRTGHYRRGINEY